MQNYRRIKKELPEVQKDISLKNYTTFKIGGKADYFFEAKTKQDLIKAISLVKKVNLPFFILGGGSNLLISDKGYRGMVIKVKSQKSKVKSQKSKVIEIESGVLLNKVVALAFKNSLTGLEWAAGIPGTVGGAIRGNAGAFGQSISDIVKEVEVFDVENEKIKIFQNKNCQFKYRNSIFKQNSDLIILSAVFKLKAREIQALQKKTKEYLDYRKKNQPLRFPSAGSIFKNYGLQIVDCELLKKYPELKEFNKKKKIPAGWLIEKAGLRGKIIGGAQISEKHCNFIINLGGAKAKDVMTLINLVKKEVKNKFKIILEEEIQYI
ncbi:MAG: UDP-N-acetylmuramate dehydrogenase [Candidatus Pacebacteria bacterium]|nr:UDP-N-acetylmuramate dehydrogenase [Candidatus Paceibacterota bacterium]